MRNFPRAVSPISGDHFNTLTFKGNRHATSPYNASISIQATIPRNNKLRIGSKSNLKEVRSKASSSPSKQAERSASKKSLMENRSILNLKCQNRLKIEPNSDKRKKLELNRDNQRHRLMSLAENTDDKVANEVGYLNNLLERMLLNEQQSRFLCEFQVLSDLVKERRLGLIGSLVTKLIAVFSRKQVIGCQNNYQKTLILEQKLAGLGLKLKQNDFQMTTLKKQLEIVKSQNESLAMKFKHKVMIDHGTTTQQDYSSMDYLVRLQKKYRDAKDKEQRFLKVLKILQNKGVDFKEIKNELEDDQFGKVSRTNLKLINDEQVDMNNLKIVDTMDNIADNSIVNDSDESSFDFAQKIPQNNFFECKRVYTNNKPMDKKLKNELHLNMSVLYESESQVVIPTV